MFLRKFQTALWVNTAWIKGWRCADKIIVIESDDWGALRTPSKEEYAFLNKNGYSIDKSPICVDSLESEEDLVCLFEILESFKDRRGGPACMTANMVLANPDFDKIRDVGFKEYSFEPSLKTLERFPSRKNVRSLQMEGLGKKIFVPQFHIREHLRYWKWLEVLDKGSKEAHMLFDLHMCSLPAGISKEDICFDGPVFVNQQELSDYKVDIASVITDGAKLFKKEFGYSSVTTIAPNYCWTNNIEVLWNNTGIRHIQGSYLQLCGSSIVRKMHFNGQKNLMGGRYLVRNCNFEQNYKSVVRLDKCLREINFAFKNHQPAILCTHRTNYIGSINCNNRARGCRMLKDLLDRIKKQWPDAVFLSTPEVAYMIEHDIRSIDQISVPFMDMLAG